MVVGTQAKYVPDNVWAVVRGTQRLNVVCFRIALAIG